MMGVSEAGTVGAAVDNDVIQKTACYGLIEKLWPRGDGSLCVGALGAARYVVADVIKRAPLSGDKSKAMAALESFMSNCETLEPTETELRLASEIEAFAQQQALELDGGESQLAAMTIERGIHVLQTGDKRAIEALERTIDGVESVGLLAGRVKCLEQLIVSLLASDAAPDHVTKAICREPKVDKALTICFGCFSGGAPLATVLSGLASYIAALREAAPRVLGP